MKPEPQTAADWRAVESKLRNDAEGWTALALAVALNDLPRLLADDYAIRCNRGYRLLARAARDAADQAGMYASEFEDVAS